MQDFIVKRSDFPTIQEIIQQDGEISTVQVMRLKKELLNLVSWYERSREAFQRMREQQSNVTHVQGIASQIQAPYSGTRQETAATQLRTIKRNPPMPQPQVPPRRADRPGQKGSHAGHPRPKLAQVSKKEEFWTWVGRRFGKLPSEMEILNMFAPMNQVPKLRPPPRPAPPHWSVRLSEIASQSSGGRQKLTMPPGPPPAMDAIAEFWRDRSVGFQIEEIQRRNSSALHCLLNAFVEIDEVVEHEQVPRGLFLREHPLLPVVRSDRYAQYTFEQRLGLELESLGLGRQSSEQGYDSAPFQSEIEEYMKTIQEETLKDLQPLRDKLLQNLQKYKEKEQRMERDYTRSLEYLAEVPGD